MNIPFSLQLSTLRTDLHLTNHQLAQKARVPRSLIAGLQSGKRQIGEYQARKIAVALNLDGTALEEFVFAAINNCTEKVLEEAKSYPAELLNLIARQLRGAGILAESILGLNIDSDGQAQDVTLTLGNGQTATLKTHLIHA